jgi:hypothetical protein
VPGAASGGPSARDWHACFWARSISPGTTQNREERRFQTTKRDVAKALLLFRRTIAALKLAQATGEDGVAVVDREVGLKRLDEALPIIGAVAEVADQDILVTAAERYSVLRRFSPRFLAAFRSSPTCRKTPCWPRSSS